MTLHWKEVIISMSLAILKIKSSNAKLLAYTIHSLFQYIDVCNCIIYFHLFSIIILSIHLFMYLLITLFISITYYLLVEIIFILPLEKGRYHQIQNMIIE